MKMKVLSPLWNDPDVVSAISTWSQILMVVLSAVALTFSLRANALAGAPRTLSENQRAAFIASVASSPKGAVGIVYAANNPDCIGFLAQVRSLLTDAGFTLPERSEIPLDYHFPTPQPWHLALIGQTSAFPPWADHIYRALLTIGIEPALIDGTKISKPGEFKIYIGSR